MSEETIVTHSDTPDNQFDTMTEWSRGEGWKIEPGSVDIVDIRPPDIDGLRRKWWWGFLCGVVWATVIPLGATWIFGGGR